MLSYDSCNSIEHMLNMIYQNQNKVNNLKNNLSDLNSNINFIQCEIPKFLNEISYDLEILISILNNMKRCSNNNFVENNSIEKMLCNAKNTIKELERVNQNQQNYINELICKNKLCLQCNRPILDNQIPNNENYINDLPQSTSINYNNNNGFKEK